MRNWLLAVLILVSGALAAPTASQAAGNDTLAPEVRQFIAMIQDEGFVIESMQYTWLGRLKIEANRANYHRQIVLNPRNGEVLRDFTQLVVTTAETSPRYGSGGTTGGTGATGGSDDDEMDGPDEHDDPDEPEDHNEHEYDD